MKAYITSTGEPPRWSAHIDRSDEDPTGESSDHTTAAQAIEWARARTDWVLITTDRLTWAGSPDKQPPDVHDVWREDG